MTIGSINQYIVLAIHIHKEKKSFHTGKIPSSNNTLKVLLFVTIITKVNETNLHLLFSGNISMEIIRVDFHIGCLY